MSSIRLVNIGQLNVAASKTQLKKMNSLAQVTARRPKDPFADIEVTENYIKIQRLIENGCPIIFVTGKAGTGKSTLIFYFQNILKKRIAVVAPTGVAALQVKGATIHSFFHFPPKLIDSEDIKKVFNRELYSKLELLIIDEISMVRADIIDGIDEFLRTNRANEKPFGGVQLLLIGDLFQLPPVVNEEERKALRAKGYLSEYFFSALTLQNVDMAPVELTKVFRQEDGEFVDLLNSIRLAENVDHSLQEINARCKPDYEPKSEITLTSTNDLADQKNIKELAALPSQEYIFQGTFKGKFSLSKDRVPSPLQLKLKVGAQVMFTKSGEHKRWVNGTLGIVKSLSSSSIRVEIISDSPGTIYDVPKATWEKYQYEYDADQDKIVSKVVGEYTQYPLMLAWGITIHKSQGKTLSKVFIDMGSGAFVPGQVYVALSRVQFLSDIHMARPIKISEVTCDPQIKRFYQALEQMRSARQNGEQDVAHPLDAKILAKRYRY